jgi:pyridoxine kinase
MQPSCAKNSRDSPRVLSIQSHVVSGYVGNKCAVFPLQALGFEVDFINSVQFSNHTGYGKWKGQVLTDKDLNDLISGLRENDLIHYTHLLTGYIGTESFLRKVKEVIEEIKTANPNKIYLCDPVLGDNGHFYVPEALIPIYQNEILPLADITTPNTFELELLSGMKIDTEAHAIQGMEILHKKGVSVVILSSLDMEGPDLVTYVSFFRDANDYKSRSVWKVVSPRLAGIFTGTGDIFAALFLGWYEKLQADVPAALQTTLASMETILARTQKKRLERDSQFPEKKGTPIELQLIQSLDIIINPIVTRPAQMVAYGCS